MAETAAPKKPLRFRNYRPADATLAPGAAATAKPSEAASADKAAAAPATKKGPGPAKPAAAQKQQEQGEGQPPAGGAGAVGGKKKGGGEEEDVIKRELQRHLEEHGGETMNVAPRKPNWDLKRDVAKKMERLNRMTQKAIVELLREKLAREAEEGSSGSEEEEEESDEEEG